ncbi:CG11723 [Drosophila busckii]|uniref:CG11723 n=1 Tax=Drosophila busckii TaxID=30019 RepID=A0A0M4E5K9_DROBS|nr:uncharacterized protein LOC108608426 [Drosophila busckii]ALC39421.1 CG11723 [Drosophila busckii]
MKLDNFQLIAEVRQRRVLWDTTVSLTLRKDHFSPQWQEVAYIMQHDVSDCRKRFKALRDNYRSEVRKIQKGLNKHSHWPYFRALEFMREIFDPNKIVPFSPEPYHIEIDYHSTSTEQERQDDFIIDVDDDSCDFEILGDIFKRDPAESTQDTESKISNEHQNPSPSLLSPMMPKAVPAKRTKRRRTSSSVDGIYQNGHTTTNSTPASEPTAKDDPDYNFLISLLPHVKTLSSMNNMKFRTEVSRMLMDLNQQEIRAVESPKTVNTPRLTPAPASYQPEPNKLGSRGSLNGSSNILHSSLVECDVKIENEPLY